MGQTTRQIEAHIEDTRENLGSNLQELEQRVRSVTDWKQHFQTSPMTMLGVAFGGGILLATMLGGRKNLGGKRFSRHDAGSEPYVGTDLQKRKALETLDNIKGALIGVAATKVKDFIGEIVPGFHEQFQRSEAESESTRTVARTSGAS
jgi:hypothetical protein